MKYTVEINIDLPRKKVVELFDSTENMFKWQDCLVSFDHISGEPGKSGSKSKMVQKMGNREMELIETIITNNLPDEFTSTYEAKGAWNEMKNFFFEEGEKTRWVAHSEFIFSSFMMKVMAFLMPGSFKKQTLKFMQDFKNFAESNK